MSELHLLGENTMHALKFDHRNTLRKKKVLDTKVSYRSSSVERKPKETFESWFDNAMNVDPSFDYSGALNGKNSRYAIK